MANITAETWARLIEGVLEQSAKTEAEPGLRWQMPHLSAARDAILSVTGTENAQESISAQKKQVREADAVHDDAHRYFHGQLSVHLHRGSSQDRATVQAAIDVLYPDGLRIIGAAYEKEAAAAATFAQRLARDEAEAAFVVVARDVPGIRDHGQACVDAAVVLGEELRTLDACEAAAENSNVRSLYQLAGQARRVWALFAKTVETLYGSDAADDREIQAVFLGPWRRALVAVNSPATTQRPENPTDSTPNTTATSETSENASTNDSERPGEADQP